MSFLSAFPLSASAELLVTFKIDYIIIDILKKKPDLKTAGQVCGGSDE
jgi:hypothetical protein